jgi:hypothetical protein
VHTIPGAHDHTILLNSAVTRQRAFGSRIHRIRAHALICFIALVLHRVMRMRLKAAGNKSSTDRALELLRQLQRHRIHLPDDQTVTGLSTVTAEQAAFFSSLKLPRPTSQNP